MEILWPLFLFISIGAILFSGYHYIHFKPERENGESEGYSDFLSFNKTLDKKMKYFPEKKMVWLKFYMNFGLPICAIGLLYKIVNLIIKYVAGNPIIFALNIVFLLLTIANIAFIRFIDKTGFIINLAWNIFFIAYILVPYLLINEFFLLIGFSIIGGVAVAANIWYFVKRKELFTKSLKEIKRGLGI